MPSQGPAPPPNSVSQPQDPNSTLVYDLDIFILAVLLLFSLINVPRALVYIVNNRSEAFQGYFLRSTKRFSRTLHSTETTIQSVEKSITPSLESAIAPKRPWHFPIHFSLRHPTASFIQYRVFEGYTVVQVLLMAGYTAAVFYAAFYGSNPFSDPNRIGWVIASQIPFVYAFATKNNAIGLLVGAGYEKLNYIHRHIGRLIVIAANVHAIGHIYEWSLAGGISQNIAQSYIRWGIVALVCFDLLGFFSIHYVRTKFYNLFLGSHAVALVVVLVAACYHQQACIPYVIAGSTVYGLDHVIRVIRTRITTATLRTIPELGLTQIDIPSLNTGWRAGQHVRLRVLSAGMGLWGMTEVHPFTIASATNTEEGLVLMCKKTGGWTRKLYALAQSPASGDQGQRPERKVGVLVEGPYGGVGDTTIPNYSGAMFVVGGSGITFALSAVQELVLASKRSRTRVIEVIWSIPDPAALQHFIPLFAALVSRSSPASLRISVFYTRATAHSSAKHLLPPGITLTPGRPSIGKLLDEFAASMMDQGDAHGAFVAVCGPVSLARDTIDTVRAFDAKSKRAIGGIQFHEEVFGW